MFLSAKQNINLQNLLNHTSSQIIKYLKISAESQKVLTLTCKWGFDDSSGHSQYKQLWENEALNDASLVLISNTFN